ncbi:MAG TPA: phosphoribosyltransferase family protein [Gemmatimonadaceae bacterium]|nr:phosphoribosyltransferase family protein [Gemmatimonadaceae bacterium]
MKAISHPSFVGMSSPADLVPAFRSRSDAGDRLSERLTSYRGQHALVLGIPRGGVPVAAAVARALEAELDVLVARKLGSPISAELAMGAVTADGGRYLNDATIRDLGITSEYVERATKREMAEAARRESRFRGNAPPLSIAGRAVMLVDDGLATGATMIAAARSVRARKPARLVIAVPVGSAGACAQLAGEADEVVCLASPEPFWAVGVYYRDFAQTEDEEVERLLRDARGRRAPTAADATGPEVPRR